MNDRKSYGDFERVAIRGMAEFLTKSFLVEKTTNYALHDLDEKDFEALHRIGDKVWACAKDIEDSLREVPDIEEEREDEEYE